VQGVSARWRHAAYAFAFALTLALATPAHAAAPSAKSLCGDVLPGFAHCDALVRATAPRLARAASSGAPYGPDDLQSAYELADQAATNGGDQTVAIVDAYDDPSAESDLAGYRDYYGLPSCTTANGCFTKVNQAGLANSPPAPDANWAGEIALDLDMVSAICPDCKILLVEANSDSLLDLVTSIGEAQALGATQISNSWGAHEFGNESYFERGLSLVNVPITVSSGDDGYGVEYPAASAHVTAVGGTSLKPSSNARGWSETAWSGAGSGCSAYIPKPSWQTDVGCARRTVADVSAVADPYTGVAVYNTYGTSHAWQQVGGTSAASPIVAATYALIGSSASSPAFPYDSPSSFNDVSSGSNGNCTVVYFCTGLVGFDGPTGIGTPNLAGTGDGSTSVTNRAGINPITAPPPRPVTPVTPTPVAPLRSSVSVSGSSVRASRSGSLRVRIACGNGPDCTGVLSVQARVRGVSLRVLAKGHYNLGSGKRATITLRLSRSGRRWLAHRHSLLAYGTALDSDGTTAQSSFRLRAPRPARKRKHPR
jgi:hypothetical protein